MNVTEVFRRKRRAAQRRPNLFLSRIRFSLPADGITGFRRSSGGIAEAVQGHGRESISNLRSLPPPQAIENTPPTARSIRDGIRSVKHSGNRGAGFRAASRKAARNSSAKLRAAAGGLAAPDTAVGSWPTVRAWEGVAISKLAATGVRATACSRATNAAGSGRRPSRASDPTRMTSDQ